MNFNWVQLAFNLHPCVFYKQKARERVKLAFDIEDEEQDLEQVNSKNKQDLMLKC